MDPHDFLLLAARLSNSSDQADLRTAVSRAYYAAFHVARDFLTALGFRTPMGEQATFGFACRTVVMHRWCKQDFA
jgi:hypothetical protein